MDLDQRAAERAFRKWGKPATYTDGSGAEPIDCKVIFEQEIDEFEDEGRVRIPRIEFSLLVGEVGTHSVGDLIYHAGKEYQVSTLLEDGGIVRRVQVVG
ncbi:hypothetical protein ACJJID_01370 [Microbulbifer sp. CnH-101-G]|uniref:head-tail joining protein n=1 Tax=Microbulbifer sp. CnH-101-G TaxID=3243393 RepID=UPI0040398B3B